MNAIRAIHPYCHQGLWVFDDVAVGLRQEPFEAGADGILVWMGDPGVSSVSRDIPPYDAAGCPPRCLAGPPGRVRAAESGSGVRTPLDRSAGRTLILAG